jgi:hypothetical protein
MTSSGADLAERFALLSGNIITTVEQSSDAELSRISAAEQWTAGALASHIAMVTAGITGWVQDMVDGRELPNLTMDDIHGNNAEQAGLNARAGKDEVLTRLRANSAQLLAVLRGLSERDLERSAVFSLFDGAEISIRTLVEVGLIAHLDEHLASLRATVATSVR